MCPKQVRGSLRGALFSDHGGWLMMETVDIAATTLRIGRNTYKPGDPVPDSHKLPNRAYLVAAGKLRPVSKAAAQPAAETVAETHAPAHGHVGVHGPAHAGVHVYSHAHTHEDAHDGEEIDGLKHLGAGWYELPSGEKVRGRDAALAALQQEGGEQ